MNREILFKGFCPDEKGFEKIFVDGEWVKGKWVVGYLVCVDNFHCILTGKLDIAGGYPQFENYIVDPETVGQYTGLTDKNEKKIFEGDIVKTHYANANKTEFVEQVIFEGGGFRVQTKYKDNSYHSAPLYDGTPHIAFDKFIYMDSIEVIGNIHSNPELLEAAE